MKRNRKLVNINLSAANLRVFGILFLMAGCISTVIQNNVLRVGQISNSHLLEVIQDRPDGMFYATVALICQALEICAVPIFAFLLSEGAKHTANYKSYFLRVIALACLCEIPYNLLTGNPLFRVGSLNPVFGAVLSLVMIYFFRICREKKASHRVVNVLAVLGALLWSAMLGVAFGGPFVILTAVFWATRGRGKIQLFAGCAAALLCGVFSPLFIFSPTAFLAIYLYSGERGSANKLLNYLAYPAILVVFWLTSYTVG